jgi:hypothetical protein
MERRTPSNTREQCAYDSGAHKGGILKQYNQLSPEEFAAARDARNPHKKGSKEHQFWNEGFDSVATPA